MNNGLNLIKLIRDIYGIDKEAIPLHEPNLEGNEKNYLNACIESGFVSSIGNFVTDFEKALSDYTGSKYGVAIVNGTSALHLALHLSGVSEGDEVITQALTFVATANAISYTRANPVFVDIDKDTLGLSPDRLLSFLESKSIRDKNTGDLLNSQTGRQIKACVPMHSFGLSCRIDTIAQICEHYGIRLIEDAAESLGTTYRGKHTGTFGSMGIISFNGNKIVTAGGGGVIITDDEKLASEARHYSKQAKLDHKWDFKHDQIGFNYRLTNIQASVGCAQMERLNYFLSKKRSLASVYKEFFENSDITFVSEIDGSSSNYWLNTIILPEGYRRDDFLELMHANGILARPSWALMPDLEMFKDSYCWNLKNTRELSDRIVNLPSSVTK